MESRCVLDWVPKDTSPVLNMYAVSSVCSTCQDVVSNFAWVTCEPTCWPAYLWGRL